MSLSNQLSEIRRNHGITLSITANLIADLIKTTKKLEDVAVTVCSGFITITGKAKVFKFGVQKSIPISLILKPAAVNDRKIEFHIVKLRPVNIAFINKIIFHKDTMITYNDKKISIDFNNLRFINRIPIGHIKDYQLKEGKIEMTIGI